MRRWPSSRPAAWSTSTPSSAWTPPTTRASSPRPRSPATGLPLRSAASSTWFATLAHPAKPAGWDIRWGAQLDIRTVRIPGSGQDANIAVAAYLAKYATKSTEAVGTVACRITAHNLTYYGNPRSHQGRLIRAAWHLGSHTAPGFQAPAAGSTCSATAATSPPKVAATPTGPRRPADPRPLPAGRHAGDLYPRGPPGAA